LAIFITEKSSRSYRNMARSEQFSVRVVRNTQFLIPHCESDHVETEYELVI